MKFRIENVTVLKKALELDSANPEIWASLSDANTWQYTKESLEEALAASKKSEELDPTVWSYPNRTAGILLMMGRVDESILKYQEVLRMEDQSGRVHISLGTAYKRNGINEQAKIELQKGIDILTEFNSDGRYDEDILQARKELGSL